MLVIDPKKRYKTHQIAQHRWMTSPNDVTLTNSSSQKRPQQPVTSAVDVSTVPTQSVSGRAGVTQVFNEQVLRLMKSLGIDQRKTTEVTSFFYLNAVNIRPLGMSNTKKF